MNSMNVYIISWNVSEIVRRGMGQFPGTHAPAARHGSLGEVCDARGTRAYTESGDGQRAVGDLGDICEQLIDRCYTISDI
jgi:hypothetical protein